MPEIPEIELYKIRLTPFIKEKNIAKVIVFREKSLNLSEKEFCRQVEGTVIKDIRRKGKYLIFVLDTMKYLLAHMMLDGRLFFISGKEYEKLKNDIDLEHPEMLKKQIPQIPGKPSVIFVFSDHSLLFFCRLTLGYLYVLNEKALRERLNELGPEPLDLDFQEHEFIRRLEEKRRGMIKPWLMNQKNIAGIGNAYSNEALFKAGILPTRPVASLTKEEKTELYNQLRKVLLEAIKKGGDMEEPLILNDKITGGYIPYFAVYDRENEPCLVCGSSIQRKEVGGRNAFFCPNCQH